jgi:hypothetical protein
MTPAQAYGHPTLDDVAVQGPTDPGIRAADCRYAQNVLPQKPACVDCNKGNIPMWAQHKGTGLSSESISLGGAPVVGFGAPGDPGLTLSAADKAWAQNAINDLNTKILAGGSAPCATWAADFSSMTGCFQGWYNVNRAPASKMLRTDTVFDQDTLDALKMVVAARPADFPSAPAANAPQPAAAAAKKGLSTGAMVGIAAGAALVLGGVGYYYTQKKGH